MKNLPPTPMKKKGGRRRRRGTKSHPPQPLDYVHPAPTIQSLQCWSGVHRVRVVVVRAVVDALRVDIILV
jgi:hypothetical protein